MQRLERDRPAGSAGDRGARQDLLFPLATATGLALTVGVLIPLAPLLLLILLGSLVLLAALLILRPLWFVLAFVFLTPFTHPSLTFGVSSKSAGFGFSLTPYLIALALAYGAFAVWLLLRRQAVPQIRPAFSDLAAVLLVLSNLVSTFGASNTVRAVRPDLNLITLVAAYCMLRVLASVPYRLPALTLVLALSALVVSAIGLLQYALVQYAHLQLPLLPLIKIPEVGARLQGSFDGPNYFGSYAVMALPPILWAARARTSPRQQALFWLSSVLLVGAAFLTFSRFNQILLFAILLLFFSLSWWHMGGWLRVVNVLILAVFAGMAVSLLAGDLATPGLQRRALAALTDPGGDQNLSLRLAQYRRGLEMLADKPWLGVGPGQATILLPPSFGVPDVIHNDVLNRFAENGLLGGATLLVFLAALLVEGRRGLASLRATDSAASSMAAGWMLSVLFVVVDMQLYPHFYEPANWLAFGVVGGIAAQTRGDFSRRSAADSARPTADSRFRR